MHGQFKHRYGSFGRPSLVLHHGHFLVHSDRRNVYIYCPLQSQMYIFKKNERFLALHENGSNNKNANLVYSLTSTLRKSNSTLLFRSSIHIRNNLITSSFSNANKSMLRMWQLPNKFLKEMIYLFPFYQIIRFLLDM